MRRERREFCERHGRKPGVNLVALPTLRVLSPQLVAAALTLNSQIRTPDKVKLLMNLSELGNEST